MVVPEILESLCWVKQRFCGRSRNSGIAVLGQTEILWSFQKFWNRCVGSNRDFEFWNRCVGSNRDSVVVPEILESLCWVAQRFCGRSRNSGIIVLGETEILWSFQKF